MVATMVAASYAEDTTKIEGGYLRHSFRVLLAFAASLALVVNCEDFCCVAFVVYSSIALTSVINVPYGFDIAWGVE